MAKDKTWELESNEQAVWVEWLFVETMRDLEQRVSAEHSTRYQLLGIAALLRKLLVDGTPLVHAVNGRHRVKIEFAVRKYTFEPPTAAERAAAGGGPLLVNVAQQSLLPDGPGTRPVLHLSQDAFLRMAVATIEEKTDLSVRELIKHYANLEGAVHVGRPSSRIERRLVEAVPAFLGMSEPGPATTLFALRALGKVTLDGLAPLRAAVEANPARSDRWAALTDFRE